MKPVIAVTGGVERFWRSGGAPWPMLDTVSAGMRETGGRNAGCGESRRGISDDESGGPPRCHRARCLIAGIADYGDTRKIVDAKGTARRGRPQRRTHGLRPGRGFHARMVCGTCNMNVAEHAAGQPLRTAAATKTGARAAGLGIDSSAWPEVRRLTFRPTSLAAKAGMDALAVLYARELALWASKPQPLRRERLPGWAPTTSRMPACPPTNSVQRSTRQDLIKGYGKKIQGRLRRYRARTTPTLARLRKPSRRVVDAPFGKRPFRVHIDPTQDGAEVAFRSHRPGSTGDAPPGPAR